MYPAAISLTRRQPLRFESSTDLQPLLVTGAFRNRTRPIARSHGDAPVSEVSEMDNWWRKMVVTLHIDNALIA
jgi:hypothetical protein